MKRLIPIILIIVVLLANVVSASNGNNEIELKPRVETNLTEMLESFINERLEYHNRDYYIVWLHYTFDKGEYFKSKIKSYQLRDGKALIPSNYYFDVIITGPVLWQYENNVDKVSASDYQLFHYRYYPNTGEYISYNPVGYFAMINYGSELLFTNFIGPHGKYEIGEYTLLNPCGNNDYWGSGVEIFHDIKLYDEIQLDSVMASYYYDGYNTGKQVGIKQAVKDNVAYGEGYKVGYNHGYNIGFEDGQTTTDEATRNILAFGGSVLGSIFSFILYITTEIELFGIRLIDVMVAIAVIAIIIFVLKMVKG